MLADVWAARLSIYLWIGVAGIARERARLQSEREHLMAGEIREKLGKFRAAHARVIDRIGAELDKATEATSNVEKEGVAAAQLVHATLEATRAEVREITSEFATQTNGPPAGPLPGDEKKSPPSSTNSVSQQQPQEPGATQQQVQPLRPSGDTWRNGQG